VLPGILVTIGDRVAATLGPSATSTGFMAGFTERGPIDEAVLCLSVADAENKLGGRTSESQVLYDSLDTAFREGSSAIYVARDVGDKAALATKNLVDGDGADTAQINASSVGEWANTLKVVVAGAGPFTVTIQLDGDTVETSPDLATVAEAVAWAATNSSYVVIKDLGKKIPKAQTITLAGGKADVAGADASNLADALALFDADLGPGQVAAPGMDDSDSYLALLAHSVACNRRALLDATDTDDESVIVGAATALRAAPDKGARFGAMFAPWAIVPGLSLGTFRTVPYSAVEMGLIALSDAATGNPNKAAAGTKRGTARYAVGLTQSYTDAQLEALNDAGVCAAKLMRGKPTTYGNRTLTNPITDGDWKAFSNSRLIMGVAAIAGDVLQDFVFEQIDGKGFIFADLQGELSGRACMPFYLDDALYGTTPAEAFEVNTGPDLNTPTTIAAEELHAQIALRVSPIGEKLTVEIVKVPTTEAL
jgi:hypothetical protein